ncbi:calcium/sodium antiporter [Neorhodopirellula pilleata]|uniref:Inner membrane protein YrbG n=1 Tax=Neorhodopirellula pilleata TaxID=2714738 RepID=A0A5C6ARK7_9BACT|nr:calcium/sodium antiporter [Neorhodopirellula pilleata]TWU01879.1 Inner membrane protein YrbG [Neorhodopirellula pilleata]
MITDILLIAGGMVVLIGGGELLVRSASRLAAALSISPLVIGLTVVAFGTSAPELAVSVQSALAGQPDLAIGNVVGSNIFNILMILGLSAMIVPLAVASSLIRRDLPLMVLASIVFGAMAYDGRISLIDGVLLFTGIVSYTWWCIRQSRRETAAIQDEFAQEYSTPAKSLVVDGILLLIGLVLLAVGSRLLINGSSSIARSFGVSELVIGLTIIAAGTSLPEVITSVMAAIRGERDIAVGNVVGSNLFNIMCVIGLSAIVSPNGVGVTDSAIRFDIPVMILVALVCLPIFLTGRQVSRGEGVLLFAGYIAYTAYLIFEQTASS